ncbi:MAG: energy-coupling factor ABC transporter permease [Syntrophaceticus sp.]|nr:energy-coupling factor ABC transporter permease [Syntrophaceticus sp.]MDD3315628.1 energy-coupling factor ABC transporter permease [Syntrophaceticus sp.]MDD4360733.1 energy-coupling factor ABC transporter permease [Syntrophaceticus sp.]MDD4783875.1 energy-coupling factor ABC transporter permease [Syntrophaceticus sp.]
MHIPDGLLDVKTFGTAWTISGVFMAFAVAKTNKQLKERQIPLMGVMAAFIFAAQMINLPIGVGVSGHLLGGVMAAVLLGPWSASIIMTTVLALQAFVFLDGGVTALGANIFNMAIIGVFAGYGVYLLFHKVWPNRTGTLVGTFVGSWVSVVMAAAACGIELALSGQGSLNILLGGLLTWHVLIGLVEAVIATAVVRYLTQVRPDLVKQTAKA